MIGRVRAVVLIAVAGLVPSIAFAQGSGGQSPAPPAATPAPPPADTAGAAPASSGSSAKPVAPATGYGWSPPKPGRHHAKAHAMVARSESPTGLVEPGFETLADGTTRLFVQLPKAVPYDTKPAKGSITYVLKGVRVDRHNNTNPLVTVHFNTPVTQARLVPHGKDTWFLVELRASVQPTVTMDATKNGAMLKVAFPGGSYLPAEPAGEDATAEAPAAHPRHHRRLEGGALPPGQIPPPDSALAPATPDTGAAGTSGGSSQPPASPPGPSQP